MEGRGVKPFLISVRNVIDLSKLPEISYVNNEVGRRTQR